MKILVIQNLKDPNQDFLAFIISQAISFDTLFYQTCFTASAEGEKGDDGNGG